MRWPVLIGATGLLIALVLGGLGFSFAQQARANKQIRYDVPDIGNSRPGHSHTGPLLAFIPQISGATVIGEQGSVTSAQPAPVNFADDDQIHPWRTVVRGAYRAVTPNGSDHYEFRVFQFRDPSAAERYASIVVGNWSTGPFTVGGGAVQIPDVPSGYVLADGPGPDNSTDVYALVVRGDVVVAVFGNQPTDSSTSRVEGFAGDVYDLL